MKEILQSIKAFLYDRASSPLFGAFIISWVGWNYRIVMILLSDEKYTIKFSSIDQYIETNVFILPWPEITIYFYFGSGMVFPLLTALAYIYLYPFAAEPVFKYSLKKQKNISTLKKEANDSRIIDEKDSRKLFKSLADMQSKYDSDISQYQKQVASLNIIIDEQKEKLNSDKPESIVEPSLESDESEDNIEENSEITIFKSEFERFLRKFEAEWTAERDSEPHKIEDAQYIISDALDEVLDFQSQITTDPNNELLPIFAKASKAMKELGRHRLSIDGGKSFEEFWKKGDSAIEQLKIIPLKL